VRLGPTLRVVAFRESCTLSGHAGNVNTVEITPDGKQAVSGSSDQTIKVWALDENAKEAK